MAMEDVQVRYCHGKNNDIVGSQLARALQLQVQCQWTRWDNYVKNDLSWTFVLDTPPNLLSPCLASTYDVPPSPTSHVLGDCQISLSQGRFTFRHDSVLNSLVDALNTFIKNKFLLRKLEFANPGQCQNQLAFYIFQMIGNGC